MGVLLARILRLIEHGYRHGYGHGSIGIGRIGEYECYDYDALRPLGMTAFFFRWENPGSSLKLEYPTRPFGALAISIPRCRFWYERYRWQLSIAARIN